MIMFDPSAASHAENFTRWFRVPSPLGYTPDNTTARFLIITGLILLVPDGHRNCDFRIRPVTFRPSLVAMERTRLCFQVVAFLASGYQAEDRARIDVHPSQSRQWR